MTGWYPMDKMSPGDGDLSPEEEEVENEIFQAMIDPEVDGTDGHEIIHGESPHGTNAKLDITDRWYPR